MKTSESIDKIATSLSGAQGELRNPERNREVRVRTKSGCDYGFRYSTLDAVIAMARPILSKHELSVVQPISIREDKVVVTTRLMHSSGQWVEDELSCRPESFGLQQIGSAATYLKRYSYCAMLCIDSDEDDDGNSASGNQIMHQVSQEPLATQKQQSVPQSSPSPSMAQPDTPKAKPTTKKASNVYSNAKKAIETATDFSSLEAMESLLAMRLNEQAITKEQTDELKELIATQRATLADVATSLFPTPETIV